MSTRGTTPASVPQMKASHMRSNVECLSLLGETKEAQVRAACAEVIAEIEASIRSTWLPLELDVILSQSVEDICGPETLAEWSRQAIYQSARGPLIGPIIDGLIRLGLGPRHGLRRVAAGWRLIYRNCGAVTCDAEPGAAMLVLSSVPKEMTETYARGIGFALEGVIRILGGIVKGSTADIDGDEVRYHLRWTGQSAA